MDSKLQAFYAANAPLIQKVAEPDERYVRPDERYVQVAKACTELSRLLSTPQSATCNEFLKCLLKTILTYCRNQIDLDIVTMARKVTKTCGEYESCNRDLIAVLNELMMHLTHLDASGKSTASTPSAPVATEVPSVGTMLRGAWRQLPNVYAGCCCFFIGFIVIAIMSALVMVLDYVGTNSVQQRYAEPFEMLKNHVGSQETGVTLKKGDTDDDNVVVAAIDNAGNFLTSQRAFDEAYTGTLMAHLGNIKDDHLDTMAWLVNDRGHAYQLRPRTVRMRDHMVNFIKSEMKKWNKVNVDAKLAIVQGRMSAPPGKERDKTSPIEVFADLFELIELTDAQHSATNLQLQASTPKAVCRYYGCKKEHIADNASVLVVSDQMVIKLLEPLKKEWVECYTACNDLAKHEQVRYIQRLLSELAKMQRLDIVPRFATMGTEKRDKHFIERKSDLIAGIGWVRHYWLMDHVWGVYRWFDDHPDVIPSAVQAYAGGRVFGEAFAAAEQLAESAASSVERATAGSAAAVAGHVAESVARARS